MAKLKAKTTTVETQNHRQVVRVGFTGIISTPTVSAFRDAMRGPLQSGRDVLVDLSGITYINSSGLGELVRIHDSQEQQNLSLLLVNEDPEVGRLIRMLGLGNVLHVYPDANTALVDLDHGLQAGGAGVQATDAQVEKRMREGAFVPVVSTPPPKLPDARILIAVNGDTHFARFLGRCLSGDSQNAIYANTRDEVDAAANGGRIDVAIVDSTLPDARLICQDLKLNSSNGILSVIFIYPNDEARDEAKPYRICEDEFTVEPFEVREIVALAKAEYGRCKSESILFVQEACIELFTSDQTINQVCELLEPLIHNTGLPGEAADGFYYATREAIDNARRHGNVSDPAKIIEVLYVLDKEKITVTVADEGDGFDWTQQIDKSRKMSPIEQARDRHKAGGFGGLGIGLMLRCTDKLEYMPPGNIVKLTKYL